MSKGIARVIFHKISDPQGVLQLAKSVKNASLPSVTKVKHEPPVTTSKHNLVDAIPSKPQANKGQIMKPPVVSRPQADALNAIP